MYNKYHAYQIFCNNDNALVICASESYKYQQIRTVHRKVQFISNFLATIQLSSTS